MKIERLALEEVQLIEYPEFADDRGSFAEVYNRRSLLSVDVAIELVQMNRARSIRRGTIRGFHYQAPPHAAAKLVEVTRGAILDIAVDIRHGSPTFGDAVAQRLEGNDSRLLLVPAGFAHGYMTLHNDTEVRYGVTDHWEPRFEFGFRWNDPSISIAWPDLSIDYTISNRDRALPYLRDLPVHFRY